MRARRFAAAVGVCTLAVALAVDAASGTRSSSISADAARCAPPALGFGPGEGVNEPAMPPTVGDLRIAMLFLDFADAPGVVTPQSIYDAYVPYVSRWYENVSYGRLHITVEPVRRWVRAPKTLAAYRRENFEGAIETAVQAVAGELDFSRFRAIYVIVPGQVGPLASTIVDHEPLVLDGAPIVAWSWLSARTIDSARANVLVHETGHVLGLPDLYSDRIGGTSQHRWDVMAGGGFAGMFAWHRWKLGWLEPAQIVCLQRGAATVTLTPLETRGGTKAIVVRKGTAAVVVEVRQRRLEDARICRTGVLLYRVDFVTGSPGRAGGQVVPIAIHPAQPDRGQKLERCGPRWRAPFSLRRGERSRTRAFGVRLSLLRAYADGSYRVRVGAP